MDILFQPGEKHSHFKSGVTLRGIHGNEIGSPRTEEVSSYVIMKSGRTLGQLNLILRPHTKDSQSPWHRYFSFFFQKTQAI